jgi:competence protein ComEC
MRSRTVIFVAAFGAGLATGLAHFQPGLVLIGSAAGCLALRRRDEVVVPAAMALGLLHGAWAERMAQRSCAALLPPGNIEVHIRLRGAASEGIVSGHPVALRCQGNVQLRWPAGQHRPAGSLVNVQGRWLPRRDFGGRASGLLVVRSVGIATGRGSLRARLDGLIAETNGRLFGPRAAIVDALVLGRRGGIPRELRDGFARSGLVHLLSISGFHVGLLAGWVVLLLRLLRIPRGAAGVAAAVTATGYVAFLGWPAPATRAAALAWLTSLAVIRQRRIQPTALLATTALLVLLADPWAIYDVGAWLSVTALWGATHFSRWSDGALGPRPALRTLFSSIGAVLATAPLTAAVFGSVALIGILLNFVAIPLAAAAVPGILVTLVAAPILPAVAGTLAAGTGAVLAALEQVALLGARLPGGAWITTPGWQAGVGWAGALVAACWVIAGRARAKHAGTRLVWVGAIVVWGQLGLAWRGAGTAGEGQLSLFFLNVGQGDAAAIRTPHGQWVLVDAGPIGDGRDAGREIVAPFLLRHGARRIAALLVSHAHADHLGGAGGLMDRLLPGLAVEPAVPVGDSLYLAFLDRLEADAIPWHRGRAGDRWTLDGVGFTVLHPEASWTGWGEDLNEDSVVLLVEYRNFRALLTGDAGFPVERQLHGRVGHVDVLKAGHHGSRTATGEEWLSELAPDAVVVSVGRNRYGHPAPPTLARIAAARAALWRTDREGTITVRTDGTRVRIEGRTRHQEFEAGEARVGQHQADTRRR